MQEYVHTEHRYGNRPFKACSMLVSFSRMQVLWCMGVEDEFVLVPLLHQEFPASCMVSSHAHAVDVRQSCAGVELEQIVATVVLPNLCLNVRLVEL